MPLGVGEEHLALHAAVGGWLERHCPPSVPRAMLEGGEDRLPAFWPELAEQGWLGLHLPEEHGGEGYGLAELAVVVEELGRALAPGPFLPTVLASAVVDRWGTAEQRAAWLPGLAAGTTLGAVALVDDPVGSEEAGGGALRLAGTIRPVLGAGLATLVVVPAQPGWCVLLRDELEVDVLPSLDPIRPVAEVRLDGVVVPPDRQLGPAAVPELAAALVAAECTGGAAWCVDTAAAYAKVREQFGRPIGQFQAVKHRCADMLCRLEQARAAAWDAVRGGEADEVALAAAVAGALGPEAFARCAKDCIQVLGGVGFTWEHDAHLFLKRAVSTRALLGGPGRWRARAVALAGAGVRRHRAVDLPAEADEHRRATRAFVDDLRGRPKEEWRTALAEAGYLAPHWPRPWGRDAGPVEQLVIDEELSAARIRRPHLQVGAWVVPTLIAHGSPGQQRRWIPPTLRGEVNWCQMFSEPGAGSDLASLSTKARRAAGGWHLSGQKVWTSMAASADWGLALARTDPAAPKHEGITCFVVDMTADGVDVRPLRELTGQALFNEVLLSDVFVPDDHVVGAVGDGWRAARTTLENERVSMGSGSSFGPGVEAVLRLLPADDPVAVDAVGALVADASAHAALGQRLTLRALAGAGPGPESSVRKLLGVEHDQRVQEVGLGLLGADGAADEGDAAGWIAGFLANRCLTIAGGTSEIQRNVIAERLLDLPRDP
jgi:alkylation response protein AidB-like acyl-CoA dehydrogenase